jgi:two-component system sensor histidine kinase PilS (NtrC family)
LNESDRLSRLLSEFLDYSGLRIGNKRAVELGTLVSDCIEVIRQHPDADGVDVRTEGADARVLVDGDADLLHRALFNLVLNGVQYAGPGGRVTVAVADLRDRPNPRGTGIRHPVSLRVRDSGPGVDPEVQERIFDPFFTTRDGGSGLGLAVVYRAVEAHDGAIFVDEAAGGGAEFVIYLPAATGSDGGGLP